MNTYPPYHAMIRCLEHATDCFFTYILLWTQSKENEIFIDKKSIWDFYSIDIDTFSQHLSSLKDAQLLDFHEDPPSFYVIIRCGVSGEGKILC